MTNFSQMLKKAQEMQAKMADMQASLLDMKIAGAAGAGMVNVTLNGKGDLLSLKIDPNLLDGEEAEVVEDLIIAAHKDARRKLEERTQEEMGKVTGGMGLPPGFKLPF